MHSTKVFSGCVFVADEKPFALVFDAKGTMLRVTTVHELQPDPFTVLGWDVKDIEVTVDRLTSAGVEFNRYKGVNDADPRGIWNSPSGARVACSTIPMGTCWELRNSQPSEFESSSV